jgi:hypothetical protein
LSFYDDEHANDLIIPTYYYTKQFHYVSGEEVLYDLKWTNERIRTTSQNNNNKNKNKKET